MFHATKLSKCFYYLLEDRANKTLVSSLWRQSSGSRLVYRGNLIVNAADPLLLCPLFAACAVSPRTTSFDIDGDPNFWPLSMQNSNVGDHAGKVTRTNDQHSWQHTNQFNEISRAGLSLSGACKPFAKRLVICFRGHPHKDCARFICS